MSVFITISTLIKSLALFERVLSVSVSGCKFNLECYLSRLN